MMSMMEVDDQQPQVAQHYAPHQMHDILSEMSLMYKPYIEKIFNHDPQVVMEGLQQIRNFVIGNNRRKTNFINLGVIPRLVYLIGMSDTSMEIKIECGVILGSLAQGSKENIKSLLDYDVLNHLVVGLNSSDKTFYETCLRCIRSMAWGSNVEARQAVINKLAHIIQRVLACINISIYTQESTCQLIAACCKGWDEQKLLMESGAVEVLSALIVNGRLRIRTKATQAMTAICYKNPKVCKQLITATYEIESDDDDEEEEEDDDDDDDEEMPPPSASVQQVLRGMMSRACDAHTQLVAAVCTTNIFRCDVMSTPAHTDLVCYVTVPCLVRMCKHEERSCEQRVMAAKTIAYLMEEDRKLQRLVYVCDQFPAKLELYWRAPTATSSSSKSENSENLSKEGVTMGNNSEELASAAFLAYAALLSNEEELRKATVTDMLVKRLNEALNSNNQQMRLSALQCLLSLSRSIQVLRTFFQSQEVWKSVLSLSHRSGMSDRERSALCALLANLLLEFSPGREKLLERSMLDKIMSWFQTSPSPDVRRNALFALTNFSYKVPKPQSGDDEKERSNLDLLSKIGQDKIMNLMMTTTDDDVIKLKLIQMILNSLSLNHGGNISEVLDRHGTFIVQLLSRTLATRPYQNTAAAAAQRRMNEEEMTSSSSSSEEDGCERLEFVECDEVVEASLQCLRNVVESRHQATFHAFVYDPDLLATVVSASKQQVPSQEIRKEAGYCLCCLVLADDDGNDIERMERLRNLGVYRALSQFKTTCHDFLPEKLKEALRYF